MLPGRISPANVPTVLLAPRVLAAGRGSVTPVGRIARWLLCALLASGAAGHACILNPQQLPPGGQPDAGGSGSSSGSFGTMGPTVDGSAAGSSSSGGTPGTTGSGSGSGGSSGGSMPVADASAEAGWTADGGTGDAGDAADAKSTSPGDASLDGLDDGPEAPDSAETGSIDPADP